MINIVIEDAVVINLATDITSFAVKHPNNEAILAYCDSKEDAFAFQAAINDLARQLRRAGFKVV